MTTSSLQLVRYSISQLITFKIDDLKTYYHQQETFFVWPSSFQHTNHNVFCLSSESNVVVIGLSLVYVEHLIKIKLTNDGLFA